MSKTGHYGPSHKPKGISFMTQGASASLSYDDITAKLADKSIMLIGLMGSGKTVIGRLLAQAVACDFVDSDKQIEDESNLRITDIFDLYGEPKFREMERRVISKLITQKKTIISVGGGAFCQAEIREMAKGQVTVIWLRAAPSELLSRMDNLSSRPLLSGDNPLGVLERLHQERFDDYRCADIIVDTDGLSLRQSLEKLLEAIAEKA